MMTIIDPNINNEALVVGCHVFVSLRNRLQKLVSLALIITRMRLCGLVVGSQVSVIPRIRNMTSDNCELGVEKPFLRNHFTIITLHFIVITSTIMLG